MGSRTASDRLKLLLAALCLTAAPAAVAAADCSAHVVTIRSPLSPGGTATGAESRFRVEIADTPDSRARGLMARETLGQSAGMLFIYEEPGPAQFWMKNTLIPLDIIFTDASGTVQHVHENARPHDLTTIDGGENILAVLEINGGLARRLGIRPGSELRHAAFSATKPAWPCN